MQGLSYRKFCTAAIVVLFIGMCFVPLSGSITTEKKVLTENVSLDSNTLSTNDPPVIFYFYIDENGTLWLVIIIVDPLIALFCYMFDGREEHCVNESCTISLGEAEGTHTIVYWWIDIYGNSSTPRIATFTIDSTPPTVEITSPEKDKLYLFGSPVMDRIINNKTLCIGKVPVAANANDGDGTGVSMVMFSFSNGDSGYDDDGSNGFTYIFKGMHFGALTITAVAMDNIGLTSTPDSMTVDVYNLGLI
jgi:hypothetical protein